jgi:subtilase family serine protease
MAGMQASRHARLRGRRAPARAIAVIAAALVGALSTRAATATLPVAHESPAGAHAALGLALSAIFPHGVPAGEGDVRPLIEFSAVSGGAYTPAQVRRNYGLGAVYTAGYNGAGRVIGIVDVYGSPTIRADLATFDHRFGIPPPPSFTIVRPAGTVPPFDPRVTDMLGWAGETTLDVEWAHAIAPGASIVLAETPVDEVEGTSGFAQIMTAEKYLISHEHVSVISQSFVATEETFPNAASIVALRGAYRDAARAGVTVLGGSGDAGVSGAKTNVSQYYDKRVIGWPASDPLVTAVGGTQILLDATGRPTAPPQVWSGFGSGPIGSGGGISEYFQRPSWENGVASIVGGHRGMPDVSMLASCVPGAVIYSSFPGPSPGYSATCGTSLATPIFAGVVAIADQLHHGGLGLLNPLLYKLGLYHAPGLVDVTHGSNTVYLYVHGKFTKLTGYNAVPGYDLASGWGTVNATALVPELAGRPLTPAGG